MPSVRLPESIDYAEFKKFHKGPPGRKAEYDGRHSGEIVDAHPYDIHNNAFSGIFAQIDRACQPQRQSDQDRTRR